jgi:uncharacterized protein YhjY with autotransporter beta-barrel domain
MGCFLRALIARSATAIFGQPRQATNWRGGEPRFLASIVVAFALSLVLACTPGLAQAQISASCAQFNSDWANVNLVGGDPSLPTVFKDTQYAQFANGDTLTIHWTTSNSSVEEQTTIGAGAVFQALNDTTGDTLYLYEVGPGSPDGSGTTTLTMQAGQQFEFLAQGGNQTGQISVTATCATGAPQPTLTSIAPSSGVAGGGATATLRGTNLSGATSVTIGGTAATITGDTATSISVTTPAHAAGAADVVVTTAGGTATLPGGYTYLPAPTLTGASPASGPTGGGTSVTLSGTNLSGALSVTFGGTAATSFTVNSATSITVTTPAHAAGAADIEVMTDGGAVTLVGGYTYLAAPTLTVASPGNGPATGGTSVTLTGTNLSGATSVTFGGTAATSFTVNSAASITVTTPAHAAGAADIVVTTPSGAATLSGGYTYLAAPTLTVASPSNGPAVGGTSVTLTGTNLSGATSVTFGGTAATSFTVNSAASITVTTPAHAAGAADIVVTTPNGAATLSGGYTYLAAPTLTVASPSNGPAVGGTSVTLTGTNLSGATSVTFGGTAATSFTVNSAASITVTTPTHAAGAADIVVTTPSGAATLPGGYTYLSAPTLTAVSPASGPTAGGTSVTLTGTSLSGASSVTFGGTPATITSNTATSITVTVPAHAAGAADVVATTASGSVTLSGGYTYLATPTLTTASPANGPAGGGTSVTLTGTGLSGATSVTFGGTEATVDGSTSTSITVTTPAHAPGIVSIAVTTTGGAATLTNGYTYVAPLVVSPASGGLPAATVGTAYSEPLSASGGVTPYQYAVTSGALPAGLSLNTQTGAITGTPTTAGGASFTITATDADGVTGSATYTLTVNGLPPPVANPVSATVPANSSSQAITLNVGGGAPVSVAIVTPARHGLAVVSRASITYTPNRGFSGTDSFAYTATNASGTSLPATVNLTVQAPTLNFAPAAGTLPGATADSAYNQTITVTGGTAPYSYSVSGTLPAGLSFSNGTLSGTPTTAGTSSFTVTVTDANGATGQANFSITTTGPTPVAMNRTVQLAAGTSTTIDLTAGATGGPFDGVAIVSAPAASEGRASLSTVNGTYRLSFTAAAQASGTVVVGYTISNAWQTSAVATITFTVVARPDPSKDQEVIGLVNAEAQTAERFATTQIENFGSRIEQLHDERTRQADSFNIQVGVTQPNNAGGPQPTGASGAPGTVGQTAQAGPSQLPAGLPAGVSAKGETGLSTGDPTDPVEGGRLAGWTGGFVNFGSSDTSAIQLSHTLVGVSGGVDYRFSQNFTGGVGAGYGHDVSDIGENGTQSTGQAVSAAVYGSYHPSPVFIDAMVGASHLDFDSDRFVTTTGDIASGSRGGTQFFGSLTPGYEYRRESWLVSPYGRFQAAWTRLDAFTEGGAGAYDLAYGNQSLSMLSAVAGIRGELAIPKSWGVLSLKSRFEYTHDFAGSSWASLGYADTGTLPYGVDVLGLSHNSMSVEFGIEAQLEHGVALSFGYRGSFGFEDSAKDHTFLVKVRSKF